jgi:hypothetical protein
MTTLMTQAEYYARTRDLSQTLIKTLFSELR